MGSIGVKFGMDISNKIAVCFTPQPNNINKITDGIFVFDELMSKRYAKSNNKQIVIMIAVLIFDFIQ